MNIHSLKLILPAFLLMFAVVMLAQSPFELIDGSQISSFAEAPKEHLSDYQLSSLDHSKLESLLSLAPHENHSSQGINPVVLEVPMPDGSLEPFEIVKYNAVHPKLLEKYPQLQSYRGQSKSGNMSIRLTNSSLGFWAFIRAGEDFVTIQRMYDEHTDVYQSFYHNDQSLPSGVQAQGIKCGLMDEDIDTYTPADESHIELRSETYDLRVYRFALTNTRQWANAFGNGNVSGTLAAMNNLVNQINEVYERDAAVRFELIAENDQLIFTNSNPSPFTNGSPPNLTSMGSTVINDIVGANAYDVGHVLGTNAGGLAQLASVCGGNKGNGSSSTFGAYSTFRFFHIVCHELGHQHSATHTFNYCDLDNETPGTAYEPGSGSTIMSYAGASDCENRYIKDFSDPYFHGNSVNRIIDFVRTQQGNTCGTDMSHSNTAPSVSLDYTDGFHVPAMTPFILDANGQDAEGDQLTYCWEQYNLGPFSQLGNPINEAPSFRSFPPTTDSFRVFPMMEQVFFGPENLNEVLPDYNRNMTFRVTVRDNNPEAGLVDWEEVDFSITTSSGPFEVLTPTADEGIPVNTYYSVEWDVAGTNQGLVNSQFVDIYLSNGGENFDIALAKSVPNNGEYLVEIPATNSGSGRVMVRSADNIFFNVSEIFNIMPATAAGFDFAPVELETTVCLPDPRSFELRTSSILGYDGELSMEVVSTLPEGITAEFENELTPAGEDNILQLDFTDFQESTTFDLVVRCYAPGIDTVDRVINITTVGNDFTDLQILGPMDGEEGVAVSPLFSWDPSLNATGYTFQLATNPSFDSETIVEEAMDLETAEYSPSTILEESRLYFWRLIPRNSCENGVPTEVAAFHTLNLNCLQFQSSNDPLNISASGTPSVESTISVGDASNIVDVNVPSVNITHQNIGQLRVTLISPDGQEIRLYNRLCLFIPNLRRGFDDESSLNQSCESTTDGDIYRPNQPLDVLIGQDAGGDWKVRVDDVTPGDGGSFNSWELEICANITVDPPTLVENDTLFVPTPFTSEPLTSANLNTNDNNTPNDEIIYTLTTIPEYGNLRLNLENLSIGATFSQQDINDGAVSYEHLINDTIIDGFNFVITDGEGGFVGSNRLVISTGMTVSTDELPRSAPLALVYPNPTQGDVYVRPIDNTVITSVQIHNAQGTLLWQESNSISETTRIQLPGLSSGLHFVTLYAGTRRHTTKIILQQ